MLAFQSIGSKPMREESRNRLQAATLIAGLGACFSLWLASGCSGGTERMSPVSGKVLVEGEPLKLGSVTFRPDASKQNESLHHPTGDIDAEGNYELYSSGSKGAPLGWYKVLVFADGNPSPAPGSPSQWLHNEKYTAETTTDLSIEVVQQPAPGQYDLKLSR